MSSNSGNIDRISALVMSGYNLLTSDKLLSFISRTSTASFACQPMSMIYIIKLFLSVIASSWTFDAAIPPPFSLRAETGNRFLFVVACLFGVFLLSAWYAAIIILIVAVTLVSFIIFDEVNRSYFRRSRGTVADVTIPSCHLSPNTLVLHILAFLEFCLKLPNLFVIVVIVVRCLGFCEARSVIKSWIRSSRGKFS